MEINYAVDKNSVARHYIASLQSAVAIAAATGANQGNAAALDTASSIITVTDADGTKGVVLPAGETGDTLFIYNSGTGSLKVYPASGDTINGAAANAEFVVPTKTLALFQSDSGGVSWVASNMVGAPANTYTQTFSTADRTIANATASALTVTDGVGTNNGTIDAITDNASTIAAVQELAAMVNKLIDDNADLRQGLTAVIDDLQLKGIVL